MTLLERLRREAEDTARQKTLVEVELTNTTPALVGSWDATGYVRCCHGNHCHPDICIAEPPRPTDIAGKTRWWLRAILAAGYYEEHGCFPSLRTLDQLASMILGSTRSASRYVIRPVAYTPRVARIPSTANASSPDSCVKTIEQLIREECCRPSHAGPYALETCAANALASRRVKLATLGKNGAERLKVVPLPPGFYRFILRVEKRPLAGRHCSPPSLERLEQRLLGTALAMALFFTGIGRMVTRGYGKLAPLKWIKGSTPLEESMKETWNELIGNFEFKHIVRRSAQLVKNYYKYIRCINDYRLRHLLCSHNIIVSGRPSYPVFHEDFLDYMDLIDYRLVVQKLLDNKDSNIYTLLKTINDVTRLSYIASRMIGGYKKLKLKPILGLPRKNVNTKKQLNRLQSPLVFTPIVNINYENNNNVEQLRQLSDASSVAEDQIQISHIYVVLFKYAYPLIVINKPKHININKTTQQIARLLRKIIKDIIR